MKNGSKQRQEVETFGDVRRLILETVLALREGEISVPCGMAVAANMKVLNDNIQVEINAAKLSIATEGTAHQFGSVVRMGRRLINDNATLEQAS